MKNMWFFKKIFWVIISIMIGAWHYSNGTSYRLCSHFADRICSEILKLCNGMSTQPAKCSKMKCPDDRNGNLGSPETCNMVSTVEENKHQQCQG